MIYLYNDLTRKKEEFHPLRDGVVNMYVCGVTVYDDCHIGHARSAVVFDVLRRVLEFAGYKLNLVKNFTDVDDKIIKKANELGVSTKEVADKYINSYNEDAAALSIKKPTYAPKATEAMDQIISLCKTLYDKGFAYLVDGDLFFDIKKFKPYGLLSGRNIDDLIAGSRIKIDVKKRNPLDFVLWKHIKKGEIGWKSPWGEGRPGWHLECSAMSMSLLGPTLDIHGGGEDLVFPHHENEIAQSEAATGKQFCRYWIHNGFVLTSGEKMSKSLNNFWTIKDVLKSIPAEQLRYFLLSTKYRSPLKFSWDKVQESGKALDRLYRTIEKVNESSPCEGKNSHFSISGNDIFEKISDDINTPAVLGLLFDITREANTLIENGEFNLSDKERFNKIVKMSSNLLGIFSMSPSEWFHKNKADIDVAFWIKKREDNRKKKNFKEADDIRNFLSSKGIILEDTATGTKWNQIKYKEGSSDRDKRF